MKIVNCKLKIVVAVVVLGLIGFGKIATAQAQTLSLGVWPPLLEVMIQPGRSITQVYKISNPGESDVVLASSIVSFTPADEQGNIEIRETQDVRRESSDVSPITSLVSPSSWFSFQNADLALGQSFVLRAGQEQEVVLRIGIPAEVPEGDYYYSLLFASNTSEVSADFTSEVSRAQAQIKIGANILVTVSRTGEPVKQAKIKEFSILNSQFSILNFQLVDSFDKPELILRLQNTGQSFFKPLGTITVNGWFGQKFILDLLPENILTNSIRQIRCQKENIPQLCVLSSQFLVGRYRAQVEFGLDKADATYQAETIFWAIPAKLTLGLLTTILLLYTVKSKIKI